MKPILNKVLLSPNISSARGLIIVPDSYRAGATSCLVKAVGTTANKSIKVGDTVLCKTGIGDRQHARVDSSRDFITDDHHVYAIIRQGDIYPLGNVVMIKRNITSEVTDGGIHLSNRYLYQSLEGVVVRFGLTAKRFKFNDLRMGDKIRLEDWHESMIEVTLDDGSYGLIVQERHILFKYEN